MRSIAERGQAGRAAGTGAVWVALLGGLVAGAATNAQTAAPGAGRNAAQPPAHSPALQSALPNDPMDPIAGAGANAGPLSGALIVTRDLDNLRRIYVDGMGLTLEGPLPLTPAQVEAQRRLWGMPAGLNWQTWRLTRPSLGGPSRRPPIRCSRISCAIGRGCRRRIAR